MKIQTISQHLDRLSNFTGIEINQIRRRLSRHGIEIAEVYFVLSKSYLLVNEFSLAADLAATSICLHPGASQPWHSLGMATFRRGDARTGLGACRRALQLMPSSSEFNATAGLIALELDQPVIGEALLRQAICLDPGAKTISLDLGVSLNNRNQIKEALKLFERESLLRPDDPLAYFNAATAHMSLGDAIQAATRYREAIARGLNNQLTVISAALASLVVGDFDNGWRLYESRLLGENVISKGKNLQAIAANKAFNVAQMKSRLRTLVWPEQGVGDEVMFGSMLGEFRGHVGKLLVQLDRRLIPLFKRSLPDDVEFFERGTVVPEDRYDSHIAIGSLGQYLRPTLESFEGKGGKYLWADPERIQAMREWLSVKEGERVIGLSWRSSNPETGAARSLALKDLVKSLQAPGARFVNLQYGDVSAEIEALEQDEGIQVLECPGLDTTDDLDGLAALIEACDEVVSIGNATAHLAGALGKKTTVLLPKLGIKTTGNKVMPGWRWLGQPDTCLWYDNVSLSRMKLEENDWRNTLARLTISRRPFHDDK